MPGGRPPGSPNIARTVLLTTEEAQRISDLREMLEPHIAASVDTLVACMAPECNRWATRERAASRLIEFYSTTLRLSQVSERQPAKLLIVSQIDMEAAAEKAAALYQARMQAAKEADRGTEH